MNHQLQDLDAYKSHARDEICQWLSALRRASSSAAGDASPDWAAVIVENADGRSKANKLLPRTSVLDRLKADVGGKEPERCLSLLGEGTF